MSTCLYTEHGVFTPIVSLEAWAVSKAKTFYQRLALYVYFIDQQCHPYPFDFYEIIFILLVLITRNSTIIIYRC